MFKTLLALCGAVLIAAPTVHAQRGSSSRGGGRTTAVSSGGGSRSSASSGGNRSFSSSGRSFSDRNGHYRGYRGGYYGGRRNYGRRYYLGGIGYGYPYYGFGYGYGYGLGFGYPAYAYDGYWNGYAGTSGYGPGGVYEGRVTDQGARSEQQEGASLPSAVQRQLAKRGYYKGTVDGDFGPASRSALSRFQRENNLKQTGRIDEDTLEALGFTDHR